MPLVEGSAKGIALIVALARGGRGGVQAPLGGQGLLDLLGLGESEVADLLGNNGALVLRLQAGDQLGLEAAGLLGVQVAHLLRDINEGGDGLVVALLSTLFSSAASTTDLDGKLLTACVTNKLARLLLDVASGTGRLIHGSALLRALAIAHLGQGPVALLHILLNSFLLESDLAGLLKVFLTNFLLGRLELCDIGVVALLNILVGTLKNGVLLQGGDGLLLLHTAEAGVGVGLAAAEVNASRDDVLLPGLPAEGVVVPASPADPVGIGGGDEEGDEEDLWKKRQL